jgi:anti-sigma regulatory factor (Ser/Thr protein kinase)
VSAETALLGILAIPGRPEFARVARRFVARILGPRFSCAETAVSLSGELVANSLQHSNSVRPGGIITVVLAAIPGGIRIEVTDAAGATVPTLRAPTRPDPTRPAPTPAQAPDAAPGGHGLRLVDALSARWAYDRDGSRLTTWAELACPAR